MVRRVGSFALAVAIACASLSPSAVPRSDAGEQAIARVADGAERAVAAAAASAGAKDVVVLEAVGFVTFRGDRAVRARLAAHPSVRSITLDRAIALAGRGGGDDEDDDDNGARDSPGARVLWSSAGDDDDAAASRVDGSRVTVAVLDTGIAAAAQ